MQGLHTVFRNLPLLTIRTHTYIQIEHIATTSPVPEKPLPLHRIKPRRRPLVMLRYEEARDTIGLGLPHTCVVQAKVPVADTTTVGRRCGCEAAVGAIFALGRREEKEGGGN